MATGLYGFWINRESSRTPLSQAEAALVNPERETFQASFVLAGRDYDYTQAAGAPIYDGRGRIIGRTRPAEGVRYGNRTDSIFYVNIVGSRVYLIAIPRDLWLHEERIKINAVVAYRHLGADGLRRTVSGLLGVPIDYYAIINIDVFARAVDALGGVEVDIPYPMKYEDHAAGLSIDFDPGLRHLSGEDAAAFVRYRRGTGGDFGRIDNVKRLGSALLAKAKALNVRAITTLPELFDTLFDEVETNADPAVAVQLLRRLVDFELIAATLPVHDEEIYIHDPHYGHIRQDIQVVKADEVEAFLAKTFGGSAREIATLPETPLIISNRSGEAGLAEFYKDRLVMLGVPEEHIFIQELSADPLPSRLQAELAYWADAAYYANLLNVERAQVYRVDRPQEVHAGLELILGQDAALEGGRGNRKEGIGAN